MVWQAYIDESIEENGVFVLGGCIAPAESWAAFSKDWEQLLNSGFGMTNNHGQRYFKMEEMSYSEGRMANVPAFFRVIEQYVHSFISAKIEIPELERAKARVVVPEFGSEMYPSWGVHGSPYYMAFRHLIERFHMARKQDPILREDFKNEPIDFIFDDKVEKKAILELWDYAFEGKEEERKFYGNHPIFLDDKKILPLQAADFWAWWVRKWYVEGTREKIEQFDFGTFKKRKGFKEHLLIEMFQTEEHIVVNTICS